MSCDDSMAAPSRVFASAALLRVDAVCGGAPLLLRLLLEESPTSSSTRSSDRWHLAELAGFRYAYVATGYETAAVTTTRSIKRLKIFFFGA